MASISYNANAVNFTLHPEFSGGDQPFGSVLVEFNNAALPNTVNVDITSQLSGLEALTELDLNLDRFLSVNNLLISAPINLNGSCYLQGHRCVPGRPRWTVRYLLNFPPPGSFFDGTDKVRFQMTSAGLTENSFSFQSKSAGGYGPFLAAAHIQRVGTDNEGSGWARVPEGERP